MKKIIAIITILVCTISVKAQDLPLFFQKADAFFKTNVFNGKVNYAKIHENTTELISVLKLAETINVSKNDFKNYQAFWINAYNLSVIKGLVERYPTKSPLDHTGFFDKVTHQLAGIKITLNDIEHKLLRAQFNDPRFHFVLVCGAVGCPPLISTAYFPNSLEAQLETQTKNAINGDFIKVDAKKNRVLVSQIMEWYKADFTMNGKDEIDFINKYRAEKLEGKWKLTYFPYDWNINKHKD